MKKDLGKPHEGKKTERKSKGKAAANSASTGNLGVTFENRVQALEAVPVFRTVG